MTNASEIARHIQLASLLEAVSRKAGNVHPGARFDDLSLLDLTGGGIVIGPILASGSGEPLGSTILAAVRATRSVSRSNANLGIILLLAPLACASAERLRRETVREVLEATTIEDAERTYEAIRLANPGGLGDSEEQDVSSRPTQTLREVMRLAATRDMIAKQFATDFADVFGFGIDSLTSKLNDRMGTEEAVARLHLDWLSTYPDSLIVRKEGSPMAQEVADKGREVLEGIPEGHLLGDSRFWAFDAWLREKGRGLNPGTSADLVVGTLFVALQTGLVTWKKLAEGWR